MAKEKLLMKAMTGFRHILAGRTRSRNMGSASSGEEAASPCSTGYTDYVAFCIKSFRLTLFY